MKRYKWIVILLATVPLLLAGCPWSPPSKLSDAEIRATSQALEIEMQKEAARATREAEEAKTKAEQQKQEDAKTHGNRLIIVSGTARITDDEIFDDEHATLTMDKQCAVTQDNPTCVFPKFLACAGGEVRVEIDLNATLRSNNSVDITGSAQLFEGTSCNTTDREDSESISASIAAGSARTWEGQLLSTGVGGGDKADIKFTVENRQQQ
jgi:hypothetical protein